MKFTRAYQEKEIAEQYDCERFTGKGGAILNVAELEIMLSMIGDDSVRILELGSGTGRFTEALKRAGKKVVAVEPSLNMIRTAMKKGVKADFIGGDALRLPLRGGTFDEAVTLRVVIHFTPEEIRRVMYEVQSVVKKGGYFVFDTINTTVFNMPHRIAVISKRFFSKRPIPTFFVSDHEIMEIIRQAGLVLERREKRFVIPRWIFRVCGRGGPILWRLNRYLEKPLASFCTVSFWKVRL